MLNSTLRDAMFRDYACLLLEDCASEAIGRNLSRSNHDASLLVLEVLFGWITRSAEFMRGRRWSAHLLRCVKNSG